MAQPPALAPDCESAAQTTNATTMSEPMPSAAAHDAAKAPRIHTEAAGSTRVDEGRAAATRAAR